LIKGNLPHVNGSVLPSLLSLTVLLIVLPLALIARAVVVNELAVALSPVVDPF
jgi:hypothetical protein